MAKVESNKLVLMHKTALAFTNWGVNINFKKFKGFDTTFCEKKVRAG